MNQKPSLGRIVLFTCDKQTAEQINQMGGAHHHNYIPGEQIPGIVVGVQQNGNCNLTLFPDAPETLHVQGVEQSTTNRNRSWNWPTRVEGGTGGEAAA